MLDTAGFRALFAPQRDYPYFSAAAAHPFRGDARALDPVNAWWLAEASLLAYVPEPELVRRAWVSAGFQSVASYSRESTNVFVAVRSDVAVVAFRGTEIGDARDVETDLAFLLSPHDAGRVHAGFQAALEVVWEDLAQHLGSLEDVWFTGHSLGGALATLAAARHGRGAGLYTFGSPRVGDAEFVATLHLPAFRFVNNNDFVPLLPPEGPYRHAGRLCYFDRDGCLLEEPTLLARLGDQAHGHGQRAVEVVQRWLAGDWTVVFNDALVDHSPRHYATLCRRHLEHTGSQRRA